VGQLAAAAVRASPAGEDPGYDDDFQQMREEVNKLSGADTELICRLAEKLLTTTAKDIRVATYYCWAKLHREGEQGLAEGLELLAGLLERFGHNCTRSVTAAVRRHWNGWRDRA
jgi:type VI secretion system protein VasJ